MMSILNRVTRELSKQRTVSFYKDQEERVNKLKERGVNLQYAELARIGVDLALAQLEKELEAREDK